ncbi:MAG: hypothetical protein QMC67_00325 [Candidatus Wallbacteria bacterium]
MQESSKKLLNSLVEKQEKLKRSYLSFRDSFNSNNTKQKEDALNDFINSLKAVRELLAISDVPIWLSSFISVSERYKQTNNINTFRDLERITINLSNQLQNHNWGLSFSVESSVDFEQIYNEYSKQSKIDELFEQIISILQKIITDELIDSKKLEDSLNNLIKIIIKNKGKSCYSDETIIHFIVMFLKNIASEFISQISIIGPIITAIKNTLFELAQEIQNVKENVCKKIEEQSKLKNFSIQSQDIKLSIESIPDSIGNHIDIKS